MFDTNIVNLMVNHTGYLAIFMIVVLAMCTSWAWRTVDGNFFLSEEDVEDFALERTLIGATLVLIFIIILHTSGLGYSPYLSILVAIVLTMGTSWSWQAAAKDFFLSEEDIKDFALEGSLVGGILALFFILISYTAWLGSSPYVILN